MVDTLYRHQGSPPIKMIEECSELIKNLCKADRFGWFNYHPEDPNHTQNITLVENEMDDVVIALKELKNYLKEIKNKGS